MAALICGSLAYDNIMVYEGQFRDHILPDKIHMLNVSFLVPQMRREFGGCAGNIAYNLALLGDKAFPMGVVGHDFGPYRAWMDEHGISRRYVRELEEQYTAQAYIMTDLEDNQITAFHPGAMNHSHANVVPANDGISIGIVAPDGRDGMMQHAQQFVDAGIPFIFDPGQGLPMYDGGELRAFIQQAEWIAVNDYEAQLMQERTGLSPAEISERVQALVITRGGDGSIVFVNGSRIDIPSAPARHLQDPTGCGDAYRAGLIYGLTRELPWSVTGRIASLMGAIKIEHHGTQNHTFTKGEFEQRFRDDFDIELSL